MVTPNRNVVELANLCCDTIAEVLDAARAGIGSVRQGAQFAVPASSPGPPVPMNVAAHFG
jgi:hypothetical protein